MSSEGAQRQVLSGWGRSTASSAWLRRPVTRSEISQVVGAPSVATPRGLLARGLGRSYGDAAQNAGGTVLDMTALDAVLAADLETGLITVEAGVSLDGLMRLLVPRGWFPMVTPGTRHVTVGGAIAADIHGKNHHREGSFCDHVTEMTLEAPVGTRTLHPGDEEFHATAGGMGLTGVVTTATLQLLAVETSRVVVDTHRCANLDELMERMEAEDHRYRYSVAWIDLLATGGALGRSVLTRGDHAAVEDLPPLDRPTPLRFDPAELVNAPPWVPQGLLNRLSVRAFNELWFRRAPRARTGELQSIAQFFHPLDAVGGWNRIYGDAGFLQYQFVVPLHASETMRSIVQALSAASVPSFLAVLKRFGPEGPGHLSFPMEGWTLALDVPTTADGLGRLLEDFDDRVAAAGGRVYLAKDGRMRPAMIPAMYPRLDEWRRVRNELDPEGSLQSDLSRRLGLVTEEDIS